MFNGQILGVFSKEEDAWKAGCRYLSQPSIEELFAYNDYAKHSEDKWRVEEHVLR
jgi:hypothetical protein